VNAIFDGFKWHNLVDGDKNQFAAVYADCNESHRNAEEDDPALKDAEEEPETYEAVQIADYYQKTKATRSGKQEGTGKYDKHLVKGDSGRGGRAAAKQVTTWVPASQVIHVFPKLSTSKSISKADLSWIAHFSEVAWKTGGQPVTGVEAFNTSLGFETLPTPPPTLVVAPTQISCTCIAHNLNGHTQPATPPTTRRCAPCRASAVPFNHAISTSFLHPRRHPPDESAGTAGVLPQPTPNEFGTAGIPLETATAAPAAYLWPGRPCARRCGHRLWTRGGECNTPGCTPHCRVPHGKSFPRAFAPYVTDKNRVGVLTSFRSLSARQ
jgi:hypothetical protein